MVNSGSFDSDGQGDRNAKVGFTQPHTGPDSTQSSSPVTASAATPCKTDFSQTADSDLPSVAHAIEPTPTKTEFNCDMPVENFTNLSSVDGAVEESSKPAVSSSEDEKTTLCCSLPLDKVQGVLTPYHPPTTKASDDGTRVKLPVRKLLCLYCDRSFVSANLRQKHVERVHSVKQNRRVSSRRQNQLAVTPCVYCDKLTGTENTLKDLFQHLINEHSSKYFGCLPCEDRFLTPLLLADHNASNHQSTPPKGPEASPDDSKTTVKSPPLDDNIKVYCEEDEEIPVKITRSKMRPKPEEECKKTKKKSTKLKELRAKKLSVKSSRIALKRRESKRLQAIAKIAEAQKRKRPRPTERKQSNLSKTEQPNSTKSTEKTKSNSTCINPYPEFDHFYRVKKITDHSIDNLKISSLTFDDVFDKAFFNRIKCNIEENLLHHIDGKLFKNEESESRISNFEKVSNVPQEVQNTNSENYGCELSLNAVTPVASLSLNSQFGEDFESQIEYGSKPSKKKTQTRKDEVHYKYFTRRKYQASILEHKENRDLSKLDMWTQLVIKKRQQKMLDQKKSAKEILEYTTCDEYKNKVQREELNRILDRRGPFEDLKEEATKKAALDKLNSASEDNISQESFSEVREVLNEILNRVFAVTEETSIDVELVTDTNMNADSKKEEVREIPGYLYLRRSSSLPSDGEIDKSDRIALICSSQETENFELPTNQVRGKNELIELTGEWARCRMYICAACGAKLPNMKFLLEHKSLYHQNVWVQHYEFVGNQSELYRHLSIPILGKVGKVEDSVQCKIWRRSDARLCTKCGKQCNALGELHRHILECGGDWTWMLARKKCKYRPFGAKSRRKRRGLIHRFHHKQKTEPTEKKTYKKRFDGPRQRPSDADTIQRMLANLPAKRSTRKLISLYDGIYRARKKTQINNINQKKKVKCGKVIYKSTSRKETTEKTINTTATQKNNLSSNRRSLRTLNKVLASRILDTNTNLTVKRKLKALNDKRRTRHSRQEHEEVKDIENEVNLEEPSTAAASQTKPKAKSPKKDNKEAVEVETAPKRSSPRTCPENVKKKMTVKKLLTGKISIKSFFPVKKRKHKKTLEDQNIEGTAPELENIDIQTRSKRKSKEIVEPEQEKNDEIVSTKTETKKTKHETFSSLIRSLSFHKKKNKKNTSRDKCTETTPTNGDTKTEEPATNLAKDEQLTTEKEKGSEDKPTKKRKLKRSFRNVINKVKKLKIDSSSDEPEKLEESPPKQNNYGGAFLEETKPDGLDSPVQVEKIVIPSTLETKENIADISIPAPIVMNFHDTNENPPIPETIFRLESNNEKSLQAKGELNFDTQPINTNKNNENEDGVVKTLTETEEQVFTKQNETLVTEKDTALEKNDKTQPITIETSVKPKVVPMISPNMKGKIRKPTRGLNDCIAMLTSKLQQKTVEEKTVNVFSLPSSIPKMFIDTIPPKAEFILRIPTFKSQKIYPEVEETALDLSTKSLSKTEKQRSCPELFTRTEEINQVEMVQSNSITKKVVPEKTQIRIYNSVDKIIEEVVENKTQNSPVIIPAKWNSIDETIQKVIENGYCLQSKLPARNTVDEIIDFVVEYGSSQDINCKGHEIKESSIAVKATRKPGRKIGSIKRTINKKSATEAPLLDENIKTATFQAEAAVPQEQTEACHTINTASIKQPVAVKPNAEHSSKVASKSPLKKKRNTKKTSSAVNISNEEPNVETDCSSNIVIYQNITLGSKNVEPNVENLENANTNLEEEHKLCLNEAFIDTRNVVNGKTGALKSKRGPRKVGQIRNKSRTKKGPETANKPSKKLLLETNLDALLDVQEVNVNVSVSVEDTLAKYEERINEDEPHLLENKTMVVQQKALPSDSEDDIPLSSLVNPEDLVKSKLDESGVTSGEEKCEAADVSQSANSLNKKTVEDHQENLPETVHAVVVAKKGARRSKSIKKKNKLEENVLSPETIATIDIQKQTSTEEQTEEKVTKDVTDLENESLKNVTESSIDVSDISDTGVNETVKEINIIENVGKNVQKRKSRSARRKTDAEPLDLDLKVYSPLDSNTPLIEIMVGHSHDKEKQNNTPEEKTEVELQTNNRLDINSPSETSGDSDTPLIKLAADVNPCARTQKRKSRSRNKKTEVKSKVLAEEIDPNVVTEVDKEVDISGAATTESTSVSLEEKTEDFPKSDDNLTTDTDKKVVQKRKSKSIKRKTSTVFKQPATPNSLSEIDTDSDVPLTTIKRKTEDSTQLVKSNEDTKTDVTDVDADSDTPLTVILTENSIVGIADKRKSKLSKNNTEVDFPQETALESEQKMCPLATIDTQLKTPLKPAQKSKKNAKSKFENDGDIQIETLTDNAECCLTELGTETTNLSKKSKSLTDENKLVQRNENDQKWAVPKTDFLELVVRRSRSLKKDIASVASKGQSKLTGGDSTENVLDSVDPPAATIKGTKRRSKSLQNNDDIISDSSIVSFGENQTGEKIANLLAPPKFVIPDMKPVKTLRKLKSPKSTVSAGSYPVDPLLSDPSIYCNEPSEASRDKLAETTTLVIEPESTVKKIKKRTTPQKNLNALLSSVLTNTCSDLNLSLEVTEEIKPLKFLKTKPKKNVKRCKSQNSKPKKSAGIIELDTSVSEISDGCKDLDCTFEVEVEQDVVESKKAPKKSKVSKVAVANLSNNLDPALAAEYVSNVVISEQDEKTISQIKPKPSIKRRRSKLFKKIPITDSFFDSQVDGGNVEKPEAGLLPELGNIDNKSKPLDDSMELATINGLLPKITDAVHIGRQIKAKNKKRGRGRPKLLRKPAGNLGLDVNALPVLGNQNVITANMDAVDADKISDPFLEELIGDSIKPKLKQRRRSVRNSNKEKNKTKTVLSENNELTVSPGVALPQSFPSTETLKDGIIATTPLELEKNTNVFPVDKSAAELLSQSEIDKKVEPPIKIIINKQKTRRKSKSFKKADLKGQNDLFEDFALVIKKPKRIAPIITYTPADTFTKDIYPKYIKQPLEIPALLTPSLLPTITAPPPPPPEDVMEEMPPDLDASVEEMDMELDETPINSSIIERDKLSFAIAPPVTESFAKTNVHLAATLSLLEKTGEKQITKRVGRPPKNKHLPIETLHIPDVDIPLTTRNTKTDSEKDIPNQELFLAERDLSLAIRLTKAKDIMNVSAEELFQPPEKDMLLATAEEGECLYEADKGPVPNKNIANILAEVEIRCRKSRSKSRSGHQLDESLEIVDDINKFNFESEKSADSAFTEIETSADETVINFVLGASSKVGKQYANIVVESPSSNKKSKKTKFNSKKTEVETIPEEKTNADFGVPVDINCEEPKSSFTESRSKRNKSKPSFSENEAFEEFNPLPMNSNKDSSNKQKDIDSIYTFTELEDLEIEKPIEIPRRVPRKQPFFELKAPCKIKNTNLHETTNVAAISDVDLPKDPRINIETIADETVSKPVAKRKPKSGRDIFHTALEGKDESTGEIKENNIDVELVENGRRKSIRTAKVKALEHIHDDALAELTESERNRDLDKDNIVPSEENITDALAKKKPTRRQSRAQKAHKLLEHPEQPKENTEKPLLVEDVVETEKNAVKTLEPEEDMSTSKELTKKRPSKRQSKAEKVAKLPEPTTEDEEKYLFVEGLEKAENVVENNLEDRTIAPEETTIISGELTKKNSNRRQNKTQKIQKTLEISELPVDPKSATVDELQTTEDTESKLNKEDDKTTVNVSDELSKKKFTRSDQKSFDIYKLLSDSEENMTLLMDELDELKKTFDNELHEEKHPSEEAAVKPDVAEEQSKHETQNLSTNLEPPDDLAEKCPELLTFADGLAGLEELENSIERELNAELESKKKPKESKSKQLKVADIGEGESTVEENLKNDLLIEEENFQELRRSRRGSRKITSYNENDLVDPLLDEIDGKRKNRKKERTEDGVVEGKLPKKAKESEKKLNSDELFDLLKASTNENNYVSKPPISFLTNSEESSSRGFDDNHFDNVFENVLENSFLIQNGDADKDNKKKDTVKIYEFSESPENTEQMKEDMPLLDTGRRTNKKIAKRNVSPSKPQTEENSESASNNSRSDSQFSVPTTPDMTDSSLEYKTKNSNVGKGKPNYCEICNKSFIRVENLIKHKRTLTHIQKLSEIEAKEAAERSKLEQTQNELSKASDSTGATSDLPKITPDVPKNDINISDILQDSSKPNGQQSPIVHSSFANNHSLKLADIINDVLNKPVLETGNEKHNSFCDIIMQNADVQPEYRRYKSLGERKSFESEPAEHQPLDIPEPYMSKTTILEKQISLLENIIENQTGVNYIDDISMSSNNSLETTAVENNSARESPSELSLKQDDSNNIAYTKNDLLKPAANGDSFLKPSQYEEISEDSINLRNYEDQKLRKTLNRDEELFLECCSLLKSGSEVSSYSNKKSHGKILSNMVLKQCDEPEWLERKSLIQKPIYEVANDYSDDNSRIPTPLGDSYDDDASNSNTISSNWNMNKKTPDFEGVCQEKQNVKERSFSFEEILSENDEEHQKKTYKFGGILVETDCHSAEVPKTNRKPLVTEDYNEEQPERKQEEFSDGSTSDSKKIITKGARKVFEGLKVSIPTEELNLEEVLNCSPKQKKMQIVNIQDIVESDKLCEEPMSPPAKPSRTARKSKPVKNKSQFGSNLLFKMNKKKVLSPTSPKKKDDDIKTHDIYDFEETQDNTDVFTKPDFRTFRNMKTSEPVPEPESDTESRDYLDSFSFGGHSVASSISSSSSKKPKTQENITKKKCMIMGRIFKNQAKSKIEDIDEEMRNIPEMDNSELVESYVADCKKIIRNEDVAKPKLSEKEINLLFDQLLESRLDNKEVTSTDTKATTKSKTDTKKADNKKKVVKPKNRKRARTNSYSTDDEFNLNKITKKRSYRKNGKAEDNCINLEQELKECIGVASRKSQRKCTSGKQNILVEYWSSDDSQFEALLESQRIEVKPSNKATEENKKPKESDLCPQISDVPVDDSISEAPKLPTDTSENLHKPKKFQQKRKLSSEKRMKCTDGTKVVDSASSKRRKRTAPNPLYHWSSSSEDELQDLIEVKPIRDELEDDEDRPIQHGWIVGDSPKKLVTMLAQAKGKKTDIDCVKEQGKKRTNAIS